LSPLARGGLHVEAGWGVRENTGDLTASAWESAAKIASSEIRKGIVALPSNSPEEKELEAIASNSLFSHQATAPAN
jgi:hypothetical protein